MANRFIISGGLREKRRVMEQFQMLLFSTDAELIRRAVEAGVDGIIVDWENKGKYERQSGADTQINSDTPADLSRVREAATTRVICRINGFHDETPDEVEEAISCGADEILLPMVRSDEEVENVLHFISNRCDLGILVETIEAVECIEKLTKLPLSRIYIGLNDLAIQRRTPNIFTAVSDGTVESVRRCCSVPFGFAGLTIPEGGYPIPCRLLIGEMARLRSDFTFLRRSFHADIVGRDLKTVVLSIRKALTDAALRNAETVENDRRELIDAIAAWITSPNKK